MCTTAPRAVDLDLTDGDGDGFLYVLSSSSGAITGFSVDAGDGTLTGIGGAPVRGRIRGLIAV